MKFKYLVNNADIKNFFENRDACRVFLAFSKHGGITRSVGHFEKITTDDLKSLISFYQKNPVLWNPSHPQHRNHKLKNKAKEELVKALGSKYRIEVLEKKFVFESERNVTARRRARTSLINIVAQLILLHVLPLHSRRQCDEI